MPTILEENLWEAVHSHKYSSIEPMLRENPDSDLINSVQEASKYSLAISLISKISRPTEETPRVVLHFVLTHPRLNWEYATSTKTTATALLDAVMCAQDYSIIDSVRDVPGFFLSNDIMTYDVAQKKLQQAEKMLSKLTSKNPKSTSIPGAQQNVEQCRNLVAFIRDITILHAIKTDNADLMERLDQSEARPLDTLGEAGSNRDPFVIIGAEQPNPRIKAWRTARLEKITANRAEEASDARSALQTYSILTKSAAQITADHDAKDLAILDLAVEKRGASSSGTGRS